MDNQQAESQVVLRGIHKMRQTKIQFDLPLDQLEGKALHQYRGSTGYMTQRNQRNTQKSLISPKKDQQNVVSPSSLFSRRLQQSSDDNQSNSQLFSQTQSKFTQLMSNITGMTKCMPLASHFQSRTIGTTQNKARRHIVNQSGDQSQLTTRASGAIIRSSLENDASAFNLVSPMTSKMTNARLQSHNRNPIETPIMEEPNKSSIFINQQIQLAQKSSTALIKKNHERSGGSLEPLISERFVKRDQGPYVEPCPEGVMIVKVKELEKALQHNIKHAQREGHTIKALRSTRRGLTDSLIVQAEADEPQVSKSPKRVQEILDPLRKPLQDKVSIDYPRPLRIASTDGSVDDVRSVLRYNFLAHQEYNPVLDSLKSRLLLKGVYEPNIETKKNDLTKNVNDFVKQNKNHRCENFTISDLYDQDMVAKEKHKAEELEKRYLQSLKPPSSEQMENKLHFMNMIKGNSNRNQKELDPKKQKETLEPQVGPHKLSKDQQRHVFALIDKRDETVSNKNLPLSSYVNQLEALLDEGWYVEYIEKGALAAQEQANQDIKSETGGDQVVSIDEQTQQNAPTKQEFAQLFKEKFKQFIQKKIEEAKIQAGTKSNNKHFIAPIDEILSKSKFHNDEILGPIKIQAIKQFSQYCREVKLKEAEEQKIQKTLKKKQDSLTDLAFNQHTQLEQMTTQAGSLDQSSLQYNIAHTYRHPNNPQRSQMIMFIDTNESVETTNQSPRAPYRNRVTQLQQEELITKSIQLDRMIELYKVKTKTSQLKDKWKVLENMKTNSKIMVRQSNSQLKSTDGNQQQSKISLPSTAAIKSRKFDILTTQDSRQTIQDNLYQKNILDTNRSLDQQYTDGDETVQQTQVEVNGPSKGEMLGEIRRLRQECMEIREADFQEDLKRKARHQDSLETIWMKEDRLRKAIESYQDEQLIKMNQNNDKHLLCAGIVEEDLLQDGENYDNFLKPEHIKALRSDKMQMIKTSLHGKRTQIWKAKKFEYPDHVRQIILSQKDEIRRRSLQEFLRK